MKTTKDFHNKLAFISVDLDNKRREIEELHLQMRLIMYLLTEERTMEQAADRLLEFPEITDFNTGNVRSSYASKILSSVMDIPLAEARVYINGAAKRFYNRRTQQGSPVPKTSLEAWMDQLWRY